MILPPAWMIVLLHHHVGLALYAVNNKHHEFSSPLKEYYTIYGI